MTWNHRVFKRRNPTPLDDSDEYSYQIHECFYEDDGTINGYTVEGIAAYGSSLEELRANLQQMLDACDKQVLIYEEEE